MCSTILLVLAILLSAPEAQAEGGGVSPTDYQLYMDWKDGREDPRLEKFSEEAKLKKIAKNLRVKTKDLKAAIRRVEPLVATLATDTEKAIRAELDKTQIKSQISTVDINTQTGHVIAFIKWKCGDARDFDKEAAYVAWAVSEGGQVVKTAGVWCVNEIDTKLFSAKIGRAAFERIRKESIERFATSRYIKLFEEVKRGPHR